MRVVGDDGASSDHYKHYHGSVKMQGVPNVCVATGTCGGCGVGNPLAGRPGTRIRKFQCRSCKGINNCEFTFASYN